MCPYMGYTHLYNTRLLGKIASIFKTGSTLKCRIALALDLLHNLIHIIFLYILYQYSTCFQV